MTDNIDDIYFKFRKSKTLTSIRSLQTKTVITDYYLKNKLKEDLFSKAEDILLDRDNRYRQKWVKTIKKETSYKLGYEIRNGYIEKNIEAILNTYSGEGSEIREIIKVVKLNEKLLK